MSLFVCLFVCFVNSGLHVYTSRCSPHYRCRVSLQGGVNLPQRQQMFLGEQTCLTQCRIQDRACMTLGVCVCVCVCTGGGERHLLTVILVSNGFVIV